MKTPIKEVAAVAEVAAVKSVPAMREVPLITVKAINQKILEQLYDTRGEFIDGPYIDLGPEWQAVGIISTGAGILCRNMSNLEIRLCHELRYCRTKQNIKDVIEFDRFRRAVCESLPTIYVA